MDFRARAKSIAHDFLIEEDLPAVTKILADVITALAEEARTEGAKEMAQHFAKVFGPPHDHVNGNPKSIMATESCGKTCAEYAEMDDPLGFAADPLNPKWDEEFKRKEER